MWNGVEVTLRCELDGHFEWRGCLNKFTERPFNHNFVFQSSFPSTAASLCSVSPPASHDRALLPALCLLWGHVRRGSPEAWQLFPWRRELFLATHVWRFGGGESTNERGALTDWLRERERRRGENSSRLKPSTSGFVISDGRKHLRGDAPRDRRQHVFPKHLKVQHVYVSDSGEQHRTVKAADEDWSRFSVCSDLNQSPEAAFLSASSGQQSRRGRKGVQQNGSYSVMNKLRRAAAEWRTQSYTGKIISLFILSLTEDSFMKSIYFPLRAQRQEQKPQYLYYWL